MRGIFSAGATAAGRKRKAAVGCDARSAAAEDDSATDNRENERREAERELGRHQVLQPESSSSTTSTEHILTRLRLIDVLCLAFLLFAMFLFKLFWGVSTEIIKHVCMLYYIFLFIFHTIMNYMKKVLVRVHLLN